MQSSKDPMKKLVYMTLTEAYYFIQKMKEAKEGRSLKGQGVVHPKVKEKTNADDQASAEAA